MRSPISLKSKICPEGAFVYVAGMSVEVSVHYSGRSAVLSLQKKRLSASRGVEKIWQKSADDIVRRVDSSEGLNMITSIGTAHG